MLCVLDARLRAAEVDFHVKIQDAKETEVRGKNPTAVSLDLQHNIPTLTQSNICLYFKLCFCSADDKTWFHSALSLKKKTLREIFVSSAAEFFTMFMWVI